MCVRVCAVVVVNTSEPNCCLCWLVLCSQTLMSKHDVRPEDFLDESQPRQNYWILYALCKLIYALINYFNVGKFVKPMHDRVTAMESEIKLLRAKFEVQEVIGNERERARE